MSFLLDTDICSAYLKGHRGVFNRCVQHSGALSISTVALGELYTWGHRGPGKRLEDIKDFLSGVQIVPVDQMVAQEFGRVRAQLLARGVVVDTPDLMIATALAHNLTLVSHNVKHYVEIPALRLSDWLAD